ncbi:MAG: GTP-binding protein, partial [Planctomycetota bacterium]
LIILNKIDRVTRASLPKIESFLRDLNPGARILRSEYGRLPLSDLLETRSFDLEVAQASSGWIRALTEEHTPESEAFGFGSFVYRARRPFHPTRFMTFLQSPLMRRVLRAKGFAWFATRPRVRALVQTAGTQAMVVPAGTWWALLPEEAWPQEGEARRHIERVWDSDFGDMRQELVLIGIDLPRKKLERALEAALLTSAELQGGEEAWLQLEDPLPAWEEEQEGHPPPTG